MKADTPAAHTSSGSQRGEFSFTVSPVVSNVLRSIARKIAVLAALAGFGCDQPSPPLSSEESKPSAETPPSASAKEDRPKTSQSREVYAVWYDVPENSLARRRAGKDELTAAHNKLRLGTMVRVTHLANDKSVIVRITDRGITKRGASIDLCKEAAEQLGMIREGMARVRMEELPDDKGIEAAPDPKAAAAHP